MNSDKLFSLLEGIISEMPDAGSCNSREADTKETWTENWFGPMAEYAGEFHADGHYLYKYDEPIKSVPFEYLAGVVHVACNLIFIYGLD